MMLREEAAVWFRGGALELPDDVEEVEVCLKPPAPPGLLELWRLNRQGREWHIALVALCLGRPAARQVRAQHGPGNYRLATASGEVVRRYAV